MGFEEHVAHHAQVVEGRNGRIDDGDGRQGKDSTLHSGAEDEEFTEEAARGRNAGQREHENQHRDRQEGLAGDKP